MTILDYVLGVVSGLVLSGFIVAALVFVAVLWTSSNAGAHKTNSSSTATAAAAAAATAAAAAAAAAAKSSTASDGEIRGIMRVELVGSGMKPSASSSVPSRTSKGPRPKTRHSGDNGYADHDNNADDDDDGFDDDYYDDVIVASRSSRRQHRRSMSPQEEAYTLDDEDFEDIERRDRAAAAKRRLPRIPKFPMVVLQGNYLYLYSIEPENNDSDDDNDDDDDNDSNNRRRRRQQNNQEDQFRAIDITGATVDLVPRELLPSENWQTAFPIRIKSDLKPLIDSIDPTVEPVHKIYLFAFTSVHKEDWYFALRKATNHHGSDKLRRAAEQHRKWIEKLQQEMPLLRMETPLAAVNAIFSRIFWNVDLDGNLSSYLRTRLDAIIQKQLLRDGKPSYLRNIILRSLKAGQYLPFITSSSLPKLDEQGNMTVDANIGYNGGFKVVIAAEMGLDLVRKFSIPVELSVEVTRLTGKVHILMKQPPNDRIWFGFLERPQMQVNIVPLVAETTITFSTLRQFIESLVTDAFSKSLVLPNMIDIPYPHMGEAKSDVVAAGETCNELANLLKDERIRHLRPFIGTSGSANSTSKPAPVLPKTPSAAAKASVPISRPVASAAPAPQRSSSVRSTATAATAAAEKLSDRLQSAKTKASQAFFKPVNSMKSAVQNFAAKASVVSRHGPAGTSSNSSNASNNGPATAPSVQGPALPPQSVDLGLASLDLSSIGVSSLSRPPLAPSSSTASSAPSASSSTSSTFLPMAATAPTSANTSTCVTPVPTSMLENSTTLATSVLLDSPGLAAHHHRRRHSFSSPSSPRSPTKLRMLSHVQPMGALDDDSLSWASSFMSNTVD